MNFMIIDSDKRVERGSCMKFTKLQGAGNDFIIINNLNEKKPISIYNHLAKVLCRRRMSIGADGLIVIDKAEKDGDYKMIFFNSDGSEGEMCGNGVRCIARYGYDNCLAGEEIKIETVAGMITAWRITKQLYKIRLNEVTSLELNKIISIDDKSYNCSYVELGNPGLPHVVIEMPGLKNINRDKIWNLGNKIRHYKDFPKGANVNFYDVTGENEVEELTFERGVEDFTYACGTGTGATVVVLEKMGLVSGKNVKVHMQGGDLYINIEKNENMKEIIYLTGSTNLIAEGQILDEELNF